MTMNKFHSININVIPQSVIWIIGYMISMISIYHDKYFTNLGDEENIDLEIRFALLAYDNFL